MNTQEAKKRFNQLRTQDGVIEDKALDDVYDALEPVSCESLFGEWKGGDFNTGHPCSNMLTEMRWYGKTFNALWDAKPLICRDEHGKLYSNTEAMGGEASLWMIEFRGKVSATMVYDARPVFDHFRKVDDNTIMGIMNGQGLFDISPRYYYFFIERV
ncbi:hypothetical protein K7432_012049 [Basidiobolus ranarum]|uniref:DUF4334 domain-containing protein n=1 Tax=Basidiobolus ranarum TaxID=34480 RepID=A0ABR2WLG1_9FUNG